MKSTDSDSWYMIILFVRAILSVICDLFPHFLMLKSNFQIYIAVLSHQLKPSQRLQQARRQTHPADDTTQRGVLLHLHQRAHLKTWLYSGRRRRPRRGRGSRQRGLRLLSHHRLDRKGERPMAHTVNGPSFPVQAEGQRVELVVTGQRGRGRGSGGWGGLVEVRGCVSKWLGRVLPNCRRETINQNLTVHFTEKTQYIMLAVFKELCNTSWESPFHWSLLFKSRNVRTTGDFQMVAFHFHTGQQDVCFFFPFLLI